MIGTTKANWTILKPAGKGSKGTLWKCRCKCGNEEVKDTSYLNYIQENNEKGCRVCQQGRRKREQQEIEQKLVGKQVGTWTIIKYTGRNKYKSRQWLCRCECGSERLFLTSYLTGPGKRKATTCKACELRNMESNNRTTEEIPMRIWRKIKYTADKRDIAFDITREQALEKFQEQSKACALTKTPLYFTKLNSRYWRYTNASLDRIDSDKPYTTENVQWVEKRINMMKQKYSQDEFIELCKMVAENN